MPGHIMSSLRGKPHVHVITSMHYNLGPNIAFASENVVKSLEVVYSSLRCDSAAIVWVCQHAQGTMLTQTALEAQLQCHSVLL